MFFSSLLGESFCVCVLSQQSQYSLAGSMPTLRGIVRLRFKNEPQDKATLLSGASVAFDLKPRCSMEKTVIPLHCSIVCIYLPVLSNILAAEGC